MTDNFGNEIKHSVIIICYNQEKYISKAIQSLLYQTQLPYEIIVCDDASRDDTIDIVKQLQETFGAVIVPGSIRPRTNDD